MTFLDEAIIEIQSGVGGQGAANFHREKHVPRGGPNGADGGHGGHIVFVADKSKHTLYDFKLKTKFLAANGGSAFQNKKGANGKDTIILVPIGTVIYNDETGTPLVDLNHDGMRFIACKGGRGGFGNLHFTNSVRQAPHYAEKGAPAEALRVRLELKLLAEVGLIGLPNAGKSTFLSSVTAAKPKIADYPFTTLTPNLGIVSVDNFTFTMADMPGLIEKASEGVGLGHQFLKHIERTKVLVHIIDAFPLEGTDPFENYKLIEEELKKYSSAVYQKPRIIALNKIDMASDDENLNTIFTRFKNLDVPVFPISNVTRKGITELLYSVVDQVKRSDESEDLIINIAPLQKDSDENIWEIIKHEDHFEVKGKRIEKLVAMTNLGNYEALSYLHQRLERLGVINKLRELGVEEGDTVSVSDFEFAFTDHLSHSNY